MGNLQHLAQKVLSKHCPDANVSCFMSLEKETGNFQAKSGNNARNFERISYEESQCISVVQKQERERHVSLRQLWGKNVAECMVAQRVVALLWGRVML